MIKEPAGWGIRWLSYMMDEVILTSAAALLSLLLSVAVLVLLHGDFPETSALFSDVFFLAAASFNLLFRYFYFMYFLASPWRASPGQYTLNLYVDNRANTRLLKSNLMRRIITVNLPFAFLVLTRGIATIADHTLVSYSMTVFMVLFVMLWVRPIFFGQSAYWDEMSNTSVYSGRAPS